VQKLLNFLHDGAQNLIELQRGGKSFAKFVEYRNFAGFPAFHGSRGTAATFDARKAVGVCHFASGPAAKTAASRQTVKNAQIIGTCAAAAQSSVTGRVSIFYTGAMALFSVQPGHAASGRAEHNPPCASTV